MRVTGLRAAVAEPITDPAQLNTLPFIDFG